MAKQSEDSIQGEFFLWAWNLYPELNYLFFHVPNGGLRSKTEAGRLKTMGVVAGVADLCLTKQGATLWLEMKTPIGSQKKAQKAFQAAQEAIGNKYVIARTVERAKQVFLEFYGVEERSDATCNRVMRVI